MRFSRFAFKPQYFVALALVIGCGDDYRLKGIPYGAGGPGAGGGANNLTLTPPGCAGGLQGNSGAGTGATGTGATGTGANGSGANGSGANGTGATGAGGGQAQDGTGAVGAGANGSGATGANGTGATGTGANNTGAATNGGSAGSTYDPCAQGGNSGSAGASGSSGNSGNSGVAGSSGSSGFGGSPQPPCEDNEKVCPPDAQVIHTFTYADMGETSVEVHGSWGGDATWTTGVAMVKMAGEWKADVTIPANTAIEYKLVLNGVDWILDPANPNTVNNGGNENSLLAAVDCDTEDKVCPDEIVLGYDWRDAILYFVFVDRFNNGDMTNDDPIGGIDESVDWQGGDYQGVIDKIQEGYFTDLGVNALWITVPLNNTNKTGVGLFNKQYSAYHGYWPEKLDEVEEHFGDMDKLKELVTTAHENGLKILIDYPMNHVYIDSPVYQQHPEWFWPLDYNGGQCTCGDSAVCSYDGPTGTRCWFTSYLPDFNYTIPEARDFSTDNAIWWLQQIGADGYRLDAVKHIEKSWIQDLRTKAKDQLESVSMQTVYMVGETFDEGNPAKIREYVSSDMLHGQFDFPLRRQIEDKILRRTGSMADLDGFLNGNDGFYGTTAVMSTFLGNHDISRIIHKAEDNPWEPGPFDSPSPSMPTSANPFERVAVGFTLIYTTKGIPLVYYGDEIGMPGGADPDNRRAMQWSGYNANQTKLKNHISQLGAIRQAHPALRKGIRSTLSVTADTYLYKMELLDDVVVVAINRSDSSQSISGLPSGTWHDELANEDVSGSISMPARSSRVMVKP